ncbi:hypothetical protein CT113_00880 [Levilactobacillus brevis]|uniref:YopX family protein n=1 Tax=Levilactobacillus brevis TaxID=1580 RepID=UPI0004652FCB|nr:YopX family protein [Levilactobacillus brevis]ATU68959.1 hypothetical protein CT113_00880 [Levilactobacillus brevis]
MIPKFRAWDKITKRYYSVETWHMEDEYVDLIESNKSTADPNAKRFWRRISEVILEQSTGLKDVNGREIYEGDILEYYYETRGQTFYDPETLGAVGGEPGIETAVIGRVAIWPSTGVVLTGIKAKYPEDFDSNNSDIPKTLHVNRRFEVVGNVHENLELLEEE